MSNSQATDYATFIQLIWQGKLELPQLVTYASRLEGAGLGGLAAVLYQTWLQRNRTPHDHFACFNLGVTLFGEKDFAGSRGAYERAIQLAPDFIHPHVNLGLALEQLGLLDEAISQWQWVEEHASADNADERALLIKALNSMGRLQENRKQFADALASLNKSLLLEADQPDVLHHWVFLREKQCLWPVYVPIGAVTVEMQRESTSALGMISLSDDPEAQLAAATNYARRKIPGGLPVLAEAQGYRHNKIRIAYCSSDFCLHPVSMLTVEMMELHDRENFEVYGFCWSPEDGSSLRQRITKAFDHFFRIGDLSDEQAAQLIRDHEIDILVDLHGQTHGARTKLLAYRPAPIQITYLGLPATTGLPCIDYVIADRFLIPDEYAQFYSEKPLYMPDVYQVSDRRRLCSPLPVRKNEGLPAEGFVYCCFNNNYKYTPEMFGTWMNILERVPGSVLWLLSDNPWSEANLKREALARGIDEKRLVFGGRVLPEKYLARFTLADLFLDSFPFNAGTTANDALWMGLPVLTLSGRCFASRMAGALLTAAGLPDLITDKLHDYEEKAVALALAPKECRRLREHLAETRESGVLFDTPRFVKNLENCFKDLVSGLPK